MPKNVYKYPKAPPPFPCLESRILSNADECFFGPGATREGKPKSIRAAEEGDIAFLTTRFPGDKEIDRKIVGCFKISEVLTPEGKSTRIYADKDYRIRLPIDEAKELHFWDYYWNENNPELIHFAAGLFRKLSNEIALQILTDLVSTLRTQKQKELIAELIQTDFSGVPLTEPSGPRIAEIGGERDRERNLAIIRKHGAGGEGEAHQKLKEWVERHPDRIGLKHVEFSKTEYSFLSGDIVDILFKLEGGTDAVVEIETNIPKPGSYQAIKYRALRCAERNLALDSKRVKAILVAWEIPEDLRKFCRKYDIDWFELRLP